MLDLKRPLDEAAHELRSRQLACWEAGERVQLEALLAHHPELLADADLLIDLIYAEVLLREEFGERPTVEEYVARFPSCEAGVRRQFAFHEAFRDTGGDAGETGSAVT